MPHLSRQRAIGFWVTIVLLFVAGFINAHQLRQAWQAADQREQQFTQAIRGSVQGLWSWQVPAAEADWDASPIWVGPNFFRVLGYHDYTSPPWEPTIANYLDQVHAADREALRQALREAVFTDMSLSVDYQIKQATGEYVWVQTRGSMGWINGNRVLSGSVLDITRQMDERLRASMIVNSDTATIVMCSDTRKITVWNDAACELFGWSREQMLNNPIDRIVADDYLARHHVVFEAAIARLRAAAGDTYIRRSNVIGKARHQAGHVFDILLDLRGIKYRGKIEFIAVMQRLTADTVVPAAEAAATKYPFNELPGLRQPLPEK